MKITVTVEVTHYQLSYSEHPGMIIGMTKELKERVEFTIGRSWTVDDCVRVVNNSLIHNGTFTSEKIVDVQVEDNNDPLDHPELRRRSNFPEDEIIL